MKPEDNAERRLEKEKFIRENLARFDFIFKDTRYYTGWWTRTEAKILCSRIRSKFEYSKATCTYDILWNFYGVYLYLYPHKRPARWK